MQAQILNAAQRVIASLGNSHSERTYQNALADELRNLNIWDVRTEHAHDVVHNGRTVGMNRFDIILVLNRVVVAILELKAVLTTTIRHRDQCRRYARWSDAPVYLLNFRSRCRFKIETFPGSGDRRRLGDVNGSVPPMEFSNHEVAVSYSVGNMDATLSNPALESLPGNDESDPGQGFDMLAEVERIMAAPQPPPPSPMYGPHEHEVNFLPWLENAKVFVRGPYQGMSVARVKELHGVQWLRRILVNPNTYAHEQRYIGSFMDDL